MKGKTVAICGGGEVAALWTEAVLKTGAKVRIFAELLGSDFEISRSHPGFQHVTRRAGPQDFAGCFLVFSAMDDDAGDEAISDLARKANIPVTAAGRPDLSDFLIPATGIAGGSLREAEGEVYLVGAGPGDPDLLTFRAWKLMQRADAVLYDRLLPAGILDLVSPSAERIYVGKLAGDHVVPQHEITALMVRLAKEGKRVLRLKGGDPFTFGRGGEEIEGLAAEGISFQVVPGITAAAGCAAYAGIPLTHRDHAQACIFVTGHARAGGGLSLDWSALVQPRQTVAIFMGLGQLRFLMEEYVSNGGDPNLPAAVVDNGTRPNQSVVTGTVATIAGLIEKAALKGPALTILGTVVSLRDKLNPIAD